MKKFISMLICFAAVLSIFPLSVFALESNDWDYEYAGITWSFDSETATLTVSGNGRMYDYGDMIPYGSILESPVYRNEYIKHVVIEEGITYIGNQSFNYCLNIESISLPESLREIGDFAFEGSCSKLKSLDIPAGVRKIGYAAFASFDRNMDGWTEIRFYGNPPEIEKYGLFVGFRGLVYYPQFDSWTGDIMNEYEKAYDCELLWKEWYAPRLDNIEEVFFDITLGAWYVDAVSKVYFEKIMRGTGKGFSPDLKLTREQAVQILYNIENTHNSYDGESGFIDVEGNHWAAKAIKWAKESGITNGIGGGRFGLGEVLTREQLSTLLYNYAKAEGLDISVTEDISSFEDHNYISDWAKAAVGYCVGTAIIKGTDKNTVNPQGIATRAQTAQIISNFLDYRNSFIKISFEYGDAECDESYRFVPLGEPIGALPVPTKEGYVFEGWTFHVFETATEDTIFSTDMILSAKFSEVEV